MPTSKPPGSTAGLIPSTNDIMAFLAIGSAYYFRWGAASNGIDLPWFSTLATDLLIPILAALWVWVAAMYQLVISTGEE